MAKSVLRDASPKKSLPKKLTEAEIKELAQLLYDKKVVAPFETVEEYEEDLRDSWSYKIPNYSTMFPTRINEAYIILTGVPYALTVIRELGKLHLVDFEE